MLLYMQLTATTEDEYSKNVLVEIANYKKSAHVRVL